MYSVLDGVLSVLRIVAQAEVSPFRIVVEVEAAAEAAAVVEVVEVGVLEVLEVLEAVLEGVLVVQEKPSALIQRLKAECGINREPERPKVAFIGRASSV